MSAPKISDWLTPAALTALRVVPVVAGAFRLVQLGAGVEFTEGNARFALLDAQGHALAVDVSPTFSAVISLTRRPVP